ncbi:hypothetical protein ACZ90_67160 [Streptomyces albus subsp. albus]|nr:hypothetical protein ACZ90_67160 [Streptomyces albus subsp. albus]
MPNLQLTVLENRFRLRPDVELIDGADGAPMLFDEQSGQYVRLGRQAAQIVRNLDGTLSGADLAEKIAVRSGIDRSSIDTQLARLLSELSASGVFEGVPPQLPARSGRTRLVGAASRTLTWTRPVLRDGLTRVVDPVARALKATPVTLRVLTAVALVGMMLPVAILAVVSDPLPLAPMAWGLALALITAQVVLHEFGHAVWCRVHDVTPRELGIALWYWIMPIAYVDRTDAYRIRSRGARAGISIVGPIQDIIWAGVYGLVALNSSGLIHSVAVSAAVLGLTLTIVNLNPLLPTDGQQALEAVLGELNLRGRAMTYLAHVVLRTELPTYLMHLTRRRRTVYVVYGVFCAGYVLLLLGGAAWWLFNVGMRVFGGLS